MRKTNALSICLLVKRNEKKAKERERERERNTNTQTNTNTRKHTKQTHIALMKWVADPKSTTEQAQAVLKQGMDVMMQDELYSQLISQTIENPSPYVCFCVCVCVCVYVMFVWQRKTELIVCYF